MNKEAGTPLHSLKVDGGLTVSDICLQIQSDLVGIPVIRPEMTETTSLGAALAAGLAVGVWKDLSEFKPEGGETVFECKILSEGTYTDSFFAELIISVCD
jgi:glycerol kinase